MSKLKILLVEDYEGKCLRGAIERALGTTNYEVSLAEDDFDFRELTETKSYDAYILDTGMISPPLRGNPSGMRCEPLEKLKQENPHSAIIFLSGHDSHMYRVLQPLWDAYITKPCSMEEIVRTVESTIEKKLKERHTEQDVP
ncbi:response regulator [Candidatus Pacearchaeota archaeon]|nr:response regulator [Candidatus Pacearchaeota archaeon]